MWCGLCGFYIIKPQTALHHAVQCTVTCGAVRLCHFVGGFGAVCVVWWTPLITTSIIFISKTCGNHSSCKPIMIIYQKPMRIILSLMYFKLIKLISNIKLYILLFKAHGNYYPKPIMSIEALKHIQFY